MNKKVGLLAILGTLFLLPVAYAASSVYYAQTTVYFQIPADASFAIAMPSDYTSWTYITGTEQGSATATDWISFNFTNAPQTGVQPYQHGNQAWNQDGATQPIFYIDNTGNVDEAFYIYWGSSLPSGISVCVNSTCTGTCTSPGTISTCTSIGVGEGSATQIASTIKTDEFLNVTLYADVTSDAAPGEVSRTLYIKSSAV